MHNPANTTSPTRIGSKDVVGKFVIPSGVRCTRASTIAWTFRHVKQVGIITTKSISFNPKIGYHEPIFANYSEGSYINAVGLANPGAENFRAELQSIAVPQDKFLLVSIFGGNLEDYLQAATVLAPYADGFELNMSCPHAKGYGIEIGSDISLVESITRAVVEQTGLPVFLKFSATVPNLAKSSAAAMQAGAAGIAATNTIGPSSAYVGGAPVLYNKVGGLSGEGILPLGLQAVKTIRAAIGEDKLILGMGGIGTAEDVANFHAAGADFYGVGSALATMDSSEIVRYFDELSRDGFDCATYFSARDEASRTMRYARATCRAVTPLGDDLCKLTFDTLPEMDDSDVAGKFFFLMLSGQGEKPFSIYDVEEKSFIIKRVGRFTGLLTAIRPGDAVFIRGPYGAPLPELAGKHVVLVGGGSGIAALYEVARRYARDNTVTMVFGGRSQADLFEPDKFAAHGAVRQITNDGSSGKAGLATDALAECFGPESGASVFVICGPRNMVTACADMIRANCGDAPIYASIDQITSCGVGICGKCALQSGKLSCVDGPFLPYADYFAPDLP